MDDRLKKRALAFAEQSLRRARIGRPTAGRVAVFGFVACAVACTLLVWPGFLRGGSAYVIVSGNSMEPTLHSGDLVFTVRHGSYDVGDVVAYRIPADTPGAGVLVIHRIVGGSATSGYVVQGDNRGGRDAWRPRPRDIVGEAGLSIPRVGIALAWLRTPVGLATLAAIVAALIVFASGREGGSADTGESARTHSRPPHRRMAAASAAPLLATVSNWLAALTPGRVAARFGSVSAAWQATWSTEMRLRARRRATIGGNERLGRDLEGSAGPRASRDRAATLSARQRHGNAFPIALSQSWGEASWTARDLWVRGPRSRRDLTIEEALDGGVRRLSARRSG